MPNDTSKSTKILTIIVILIVFVDGVLIGKHLQKKSPVVSAGEPIFLEDVFDDFENRLSSE